MTVPIPAGVQAKDSPAQPAALEPGAVTNITGPDAWHDPLGRLLAERELHRTLVRYAQLCDQRQWDALPDIFAPDATADYGGWPLAHPGQILRMLQRHLGGCGPTQHLLGNLLCDTGDDGRPATRITVRACHQGAGDRAEERYECLGEYRDRWVWVDGAGWRIGHRRMVIGFETGNRGLLGPG